MERTKLKDKKMTNSEIVSFYGSDIFEYKDYTKSAGYLQHKGTSVREHSISTARISVALARHTPFKYDYAALVRGSLLHDYFLYDWHDKNKDIEHHMYNHASRALQNAARDFAINPIEADMIKKHMFPVNLTAIPRYRETFLLTLSDKIAALREIFLWKR